MPDKTLDAPIHLSDCKIDPIQASLRRILPLVRGAVLSVVKDRIIEAIVHTLTQLVKGRYVKIGKALNYPRLPI